MTSHGPSVRGGVLALGRAEVDLHLPALQVAGRPVVEDRVAEDVLAGLLRGQRGAVPARRRRPPRARSRTAAQPGGHGDVVVRADQRVRVGEVEGRRLRTTRARRRRRPSTPCATPSTCSSNATKSRTVGGCQRRQQPDRRPAARPGPPAPRRRPRARPAAPRGPGRAPSPGGERVQAGVAETTPAATRPSASQVANRIRPAGATNRPLSGSLNDFCATNSFIAFAVPHWSLTSGLVKSYMCGCQVSSSTSSSSVVYSTVLPCGSRK